MQLTGRQSGGSEPGVPTVSFSGRLPSDEQPVRRRDLAYQVITRTLAVALLPLALLIKPRRAARVCSQWALAARFPAEDLSGLTPATREAFEAARTLALLRDGALIGLTSGYRSPQQQAELFHEALLEAGSPAAARLITLPAEESQHVRGIALDVRPSEGARWLEQHGARFGLYRIYDNEWWHFEYWPQGAPRRLPHPGAAKR